MVLRCKGYQSNISDTCFVTSEIENDTSCLNYRQLMMSKIKQININYFIVSSDASGDMSEDVSGPGAVSKFDQNCNNKGV